MINSSALKSAAMGWLRYGRKFPVVCSEVGRWHADVLGISNEAAVEVETKISKADLRAEFRNKKAKWYLYNNAQEISGHVPNWFYFMVPATLAEDASALTKELAPKAGVLSYNAEGTGSYYREDVSVVRRAQKLKTSPPTKFMVAAATARLSSEVCGLRLREVKFQEQVLAMLQAEADRFGLLLARSAGTLDIEAPAEDRERRAQELAFCVDGIENWALLPVDEKKRWLTAADKLLNASFVETKG